ncbi:MAG: YbhB/YbcL family Raf kinase inhibitor-like protein [candidate division FCPU426 bacterium]
MPKPGGYRKAAVAVILGGLLAAGCATRPESGPAAATEVSGMKISSPAFQTGQPIPARYTCDGEDLSPALSWSGVPAGAKSLAMICEDPDAPMGTWVHWIVINILPAASGIPESGPLPAGAVEVKNSFGKTAYGGPCPPGGTHRYFFRLYALDTERLDTLTLANYRTQLQPHILAQAEWMGTYRRNR